MFGFFLLSKHKFFLFEMEIPQKQRQHYTFVLVSNVTIIKKDKKIKNEMQTSIGFFFLS